MNVATSSLGPVGWTLRERERAMWNLKTSGFKSQVYTH